MKAALIVPRVFPEIKTNWATILDMATEAANAGAELLLFPEAALTGLINNGDPIHDLPLGQPIPGPMTDALAVLARTRQVWLAIGLLERVGQRLYDSAVLLTSEGMLGLTYRRIHPQWHSKHADPTVYCQGTVLSKVETPLGSFVFLICGDLFDDELIHRTRALHPDWVLLPFARCFEDGSWDQGRWDSEELPLYIQRVKLVGVPTLMTNYLAGPGLADGNSFGGALVVSGDGTVLKRFPLGTGGILLVEL